MGTKTGVNWCHHTLNPWRGCTPSEPNYGGCDHCYARNDFSVKLHGIKWGPNERRVIKAESGWSEPYRWNRAAECAGERRRVFVGSLMDFAERRPELDRPRERLWNIIRQCTSLDFLLLTKRIEEVPRLWQQAWGGGSPENVWLGATVENQPAADARSPILCRIPAAKRFLSVEPMLGPIELTDRCRSHNPDASAQCSMAMGHHGYHRALRPTGGWGRDEPQFPAIDWVIVGGESGPNCRPCDPDWIRSVVEQCRVAGVPVWVKQMGGHPYKRDRLEDIPEDLRIRELPR